MSSSLARLDGCKTFYLELYRVMIITTARFFHRTQEVSHLALCAKLKAPRRKTFSVVRFLMYIIIINQTQWWGFNRSRRGLPFFRDRHACFTQIANINQSVATCNMIKKKCFSLFWQLFNFFLLSAIMNLLDFYHLHARQQ